MKTKAIIEKGKDGTFGIYTPDTDYTIIGEGKTVKEAKEDFLNSAREMADYYRAKGKALPEELETLAFDFSYDVSALFDAYPLINVTQFAKAIGINPVLMRQYKAGTTYISAERKKQIEEFIHTIGQQMCEFSIA